MLVSYPALFYFENSEGYEPGFSVFFPDFPNMGGTSGSTVSEALEMASDYLGILLADDIEEERESPKPSLISSLSLEKNNPFKDDTDFTFEYDSEKSFVSMVSVDLSKYLGSNDPVKKTLTIPKWADRLGKDLNLNFSKTLTDAIVSKKWEV
ncbi:type II toxin-antitoxin system HicB family antitoxin [Enterococcus dongliensis]|uniref:Type II toxin-antitoxin system HicB family antitoxin n=1 Tax=Enterococcus dongliensis TaxID=2559925 RepID=A0AAW8TNA0_9ENTE|nr:MULTISPECIES: type II toxin-antitoxin system HicB family antitoxin [Enterococcus]MDT2597356.1 type II toxin-antitoxin system HicB family antitoxin [Enterococcus dongliensis]MDT2614552.1 type II toxin-antitoxin system HicB family antitoxin [Enterococcus dongliensis]MDT2635382.1 type II toxin-antitoxin system HicB family antitoxin [Enterococcus dongliensis]MDT2638129.1 type II toxin-antitoxin system HicB family antitoxin [Enterococcus dongliensis]MDT2643460.1 type II toxin-antitoxin system Hi